MSHLFKTGNSIFKVGNNIYKINDRLNVVIQNKGGFGATMELLRTDPIIANQRMAVTSGNSCKIVNIYTFATIATISFSSACIGVAWDSPNGKLYVTSGGALYSVNTTTWVATNTGLITNSYNGIAIDPNPSNNRLLIAGASKIYFVDIETYTISTMIATGVPSAYGIAFDPLENNRLYVCNYSHNFISIVDTDNYTILDNISGFTTPIDISFDPNHSNNRFLVSEYTANNIAYVNRTTKGIIKRVSMTNRPDGISFDPNYLNNRYYVAIAPSGQYVAVEEFLN